MGKLSGKYCIVGVGESVYARGAGRTPLSLATEAARNAVLDAGLESWELNGCMTYHDYDGPSGTEIATNVGFRLQFYMDARGGGACAEPMVAAAVSALDEGNCDICLVVRGLNGYTAQRLGHTGVRGGMPIFGTCSNMGMMASNPVERIYGWQSPAQRTALAAMRHMHEYGTTNADMAAVRVAHSKHASNNPKAVYKKRVTVGDVLDSRWIVKPFHLLDCCAEVDGAAALIVCSAERALSLRQRPVYILGLAGRVYKPRGDWEFAKHPISTTAQGQAAKIAMGMAGVRPQDVDFTQSADNFTYTALTMLEDAGYCQKGEGGAYVSSGAVELGGARPDGTSGGNLCEAYVDNMNLVVETVRQLRGQADDYCPGWAQGVHSHDYSEGRCRQVPNARIGHTMGAGYFGLSANSAVLSSVLTR